jgi:hypothetical protein
MLWNDVSLVSIGLLGGGRKQRKAAVPMSVPTGRRIGKAQFSLTPGEI